LGIGVGFSIQENLHSSIKRLTLCCAVFLSAFVLMRMFGGSFGNYRGWPRGDGSRPGEDHVSPFLSFFIMSKYPPSPSFACFYGGLDIAFIVFFYHASANFPFAPMPLQQRCQRWLRLFAEWLWNTILLFGQVPLFFYILHFWMLGILAGIACAITDSFQLSLPLCVPLWLTVILTLRPVCRRYGIFKRTTPRHSLWRYL
jgi:hypothetical protein